MCIRVRGEIASWIPLMEIVVSIVGTINGVSGFYYLYYWFFVVSIICIIGSSWLAQLMELLRPFTGNEQIGPFRAVVSGHGDCNRLALNVASPSKLLYGRCLTVVAVPREVAMRAPSRRPWIDQGGRGLSISEPSNGNQGRISKGTRSLFWPGGFFGPQASKEPLGQKTTSGSL